MTRSSNLRRRLLFLAALALAVFSVAGCGNGMPQDLLTAPFGATGGHGSQPESTPSPGDRLASARATLGKARTDVYDGNYAMAIGELQSVMELVAGAPEEEEAQFLLGVSYLGRKNYYEAARRLEGFVQRYTNGKWTAKGRFYLAAADLGIGAPDAAIANYELFGKLEPSMRPYMDFVIADLLKGRAN
ncbi:MAG: hypothetical protein HY677_04190, partial [Chloroflexi bacterium]|nr:hypothetical protein [Chloroflexota bacterium]